jgi:23S rRNA (pseudouridine1915-N3)-methyltransferase
MFDITIVAIGKLKESYFQEAFSVYVKRLWPYARLKLVELPAASFSSGGEEKAKKQESERLKIFLAKEADRNNYPVIYLLSERGKRFTSLEMADWLNNNQTVVLAIGGALGFSADLYELYPQISLSPLTFPHELARVVLIEQLYRAATIINNKDYHYD